MTDNVNFALEELMPNEAGVAARDAFSQELRAAGGAMLALAGKLTGNDCVAALRSALSSVDPFEALAVGWSKVAALRDYGKTRGSGTVKLGTHTLGRDLHPIITFIVGPVTSKPIRFTLRLDAQFTAVALVVVEGRIVEAACGACEIGSSLNYHATEIWPRHCLKRFSTPGRYLFKHDGIALYE